MLPCWIPFTTIPLLINTNMWCLKGVHLCFYKRNSHHIFITTCTVSPDFYYLIKTKHPAYPLSFCLQLNGFQLNFEAYKSFTPICWRHVALMCLTAPGSMKVGPLTLLLLCLLELTERSSMENNGVTVWIRVEQKKPQIQKKRRKHQSSLRGSASSDWLDQHKNNLG